MPKTSRISAAVRKRGHRTRSAALRGPPATNPTTENQPSAHDPPLDTFIRGVDHLAHFRLERQERRDVLPGVAPGLPDHGQLLAPLLFKRLERHESAVSEKQFTDTEAIVDALSLKTEGGLKTILEAIEKLPNASPAR
jgi:hypothetical protein